jgi:hypothetical protein
MPDETCRCEVLDATTEGGGTDPRCCPVHAYEAGRSHERACIIALIESRLMALEPNDADPSDEIHGRVMELRYMRLLIGAR